MNNIYLIVGRSGSGKTTLVNRLSEKYNLKELLSYTERPRRYEEEKGHIFLTKEDFDKLENLCAYTVYNNYRYGVTKELIDSSDLYIIDPAGVDYLLEHYKGKKHIFIFYIINEIFDDEGSRIERMKKRGDSDEMIEKRIKYDSTAFKNFNYDCLIINNKTVDKAVDKIYKVICNEEGIEE